MKCIQDHAAGGNYTSLVVPERERNVSGGTDVGIDDRDAGILSGRTVRIDNQGRARYNRLSPASALENVTASSVCKPSENYQALPKADKRRYHHEPSLNRLWRLGEN